MGVWRRRQRRMCRVETEHSLLLTLSPHVRPPLPPLHRLARRATDGRTCVLYARRRRRRRQRQRMRGAAPVFGAPSTAAAAAATQHRTADPLRRRATSAIRVRIITGSSLLYLDARAAHATFFSLLFFVFFQISFFPLPPLSSRVAFSFCFSFDRR